MALEYRFKYKHVMNLIYFNLLEFGNIQIEVIGPKFLIIDYVDKNKLLWNNLGVQPTPKMSNKVSFLRWKEVECKIETWKKYKHIPMGMKMCETLYN